MEFIRKNSTLLSILVFIIIGIILFIFYSGTNLFYPATNLFLKNPFVRNQTEQPNILFIMTDDQELDSLQYLPNIEKYLVKEGTSFSRYFDNYALCCVARASILRGQYPNNSHVKGNDLPNGGFEKFNALGEDGEKQTIAVWLQNGGYKTVFIGKYLNGYGDEGRSPKEYVPPGWNEWFASFNQDVFDYEINNNGTVIAFGNQPEDFKTDVLSDKTINFLKNRKEGDAPFFIHLSPLAPHGPATPAPRHENLMPDLKAPHSASFNEADVSDKPLWIRELPLLKDNQILKIDREYRDRILSMQSEDEMVAKIIQTLEDTGEIDNTYIFFTTDNGYHLGQHRLESGKQSIYEEDIHLPLIVRGPGVAKGAVVDEIVGNIDLAPTFAEIAGNINVPIDMDGRSFAGLVSSNFQKPSTWRNGYLIGFEVGDLLYKTRENMSKKDNGDPDFLTEGIGDPKKPYKNKKAYAGVRTENYKYVEFLNGDRELYDLRKDPLELTSIDKTASPQIIKSLQDMLSKLRVCSGESCRIAEEMEIVD